MNSYFSTFVTGFGELIEKTLVNRIKDIQIDLLTDGLIIYKTASNPSEIRKLKLLNNSFILLKKFDRLSLYPVLDIMKALIKDKNLETTIKPYYFNKHLKFRIRASVENQFVSIDKNIHKNLEDKIVSLLQNFQVDRSLPDIEILILVRSESFALVGLQFTRRPNYEKTLIKGELYPELAYILCLISEPSKDDIFFDPFAGHGSIPAQRLNFPYKQIRASEIDKNLQEKLKKKFGKRVFVDSVNALSLSTIPDGSTDKIVTDPPWGLYDTNKDISEFYSLMFKQLYRVLKPKGVIVVLTAQKELLEKLIEEYRGKLKLEEKYNTLVSGKKAGVYKIRKTN